MLERSELGGGADLRPAAIRPARCPARRRVPTTLGVDSTVNPDRIVLTASTSEAYSLLFKLLCEPQGDAVMVPVPSYPLFDHLTALDGVQTIPYRLDYHGRWTMAREDVEQQLDRRVRAVLAVSPNNPTGSVLSARRARDALSTLCADRDAALIVDEVFADYPLMSGGQAASQTAFLSARGARPTRSRSATSAFAEASADRRAWRRLVALSPFGARRPLEIRRAAAGKAGMDPGRWAGRRSCAKRWSGLEVICDAYLSVSTPVQVAAPALIRAGAPVRAQILDRVRQQLPHAPGRRVAPSGDRGRSRPRPAGRRCCACRRRGPRRTSSSSSSNATACSCIPVSSSTFPTKPFSSSACLAEPRGV